jgi:hypothetical protein
MKLFIRCIFVFLCISVVQAAPLPKGTKLTIAPGHIFLDEAGLSYQCMGSCMWQQMSPPNPPGSEGFWSPTPIGPGLDGGIILGKNQTSGGQEKSYPGPRTPGEMTGPSYIWGNFTLYSLTFSTAPMTGINGDVGVSVATSDASSNIFDSSSCMGSGCAGITVLGAFHLASEGYAAPLGIPSGVVTNWSVSGDKYVLDYSKPETDGNASFFSDVPTRIHLEGKIVPAAVATIRATWVPRNENTPSTWMYIFGEKMLSINQVTINGTNISVLQKVDDGAIFALMPPTIRPPYTLSVTNNSGTDTYPKWLCF